MGFSTFTYYRDLAKYRFQTRGIMGKYRVARWKVPPITEAELRALWGDR